MSRQISTLLAGCAGLLAPVGAMAADWQFEVTPYLWLPTLSSNLDIGPNPPVDGSGSFLDILDGAFMITGEARKDEWSLVGDFIYLDMSNDVAKTSFGALAEWGLGGTMTTVGAGYAFYNSPALRLEAMGALRFWDVKLETRVLRFRAEANREWVDPLVGLRFEAPIGDNFEVSGMANVGGFGGTTEKQWEALAQIDWNITDHLSLAAGYRHLFVDLDDKGLVMDLTLSGPYAALGFNF
ncbi:hypothetical protein OU789_07970 [Halocynthiibacter sp. C4]|uniref:hypothetical protein n=1 Tax=Halocynthiibacter sp. C4 TaxID=2992758 RepID=UPI00237AFF30|nr:hypothetical protein [Halocynthiibacter sp. C4]MDE0589856.1 hypothetical protein [Halocynthiibacter sp. C4]